MRSRWWLAAALVGCASDEPDPAFFGGGADARVILADAATRDAQVADASMGMGMDAAVVAEPGAEVGRLAGFTAAHNRARAKVSSEPPLAPLAWSNEIALVAQAYAEQLASTCLDTLTHSNARNGWGENLASFGVQGGTGLEPNGSAAGTVELWESELACYTFGPFQSGTNATCSAACERFGGCGHYTQLVWRSTQRVGCGVASCTAGGWRRSYWVCNYDPAGNYNGQEPY
ncbi:MAG: CAP domain-containing protein [Polyangiales bacterium]